MSKEHPQTAYRKYAVLIGTISENCDKTNNDKKCIDKDLCEEKNGYEYCWNR